MTITAIDPGYRRSAVCELGADLRTFEIETDKLALGTCFAAGEIVVIERPVAQGGMRAQNKSFAMVLEAYIHIRDAASKAGCVVYGIPCGDWRQLCGISRGSAAQDYQVEGYCRRMLGLPGMHLSICPEIPEFKKGSGSLSSKDKRDAAALALCFRESIKNPKSGWERWLV